MSAFVNTRDQIALGLRQADGYVERDPGAMSIDELYGRVPADESEIVPESCDADDDEYVPVIEDRCEFCGEFESECTCTDESDDDEPTLEEYADAAERRMTRCEE